MEKDTKNDFPNNKLKVAPHTPGVQALLPAGSSNSSALTIHTILYDFIWFYMILYDFIQKDLLMPQVQAL